MTRQFEVPTEHKSYLDLKVQGSPPATPASGYLRVYGNADKTVHAIDDTGSDPTGGGGASENVVDHGDLGASETFDYGDGANHQGTVTAALTLTLAGWSSAGPPATADRLVARFTNDGTGGYGVPTLGAEVVNATDWAAVWDDAAGALNEAVFESWDGGTTVYIANLPLPSSGGGEIDYAEITSPVNVTATTEAGATTIITGGANTYGGSAAVMIHVFLPAVAPPSGVSFCEFYLFDGSSSIGRLGYVEMDSGSVREPVNLWRRLTPSAASHTYSVRGVVGSGTAVVDAGAAGAGASVPAFMRISPA